MTPSRRRRVSGPRTVPIASLVDGKSAIIRVADSRRLKLTAALIEKIVEHLTSGAPVERCAEACGVSGDTVAQWVARGIRDDEPTDSLYVELARAVARARGAWWVDTYRVIGNGGPGHSGRAWLAERLDPSLHPPRQRLEHGGIGGGAIKIEPMSLALPTEVDQDGRPLDVASSSSDRDLKPANIVQRDINPANGGQDLVARGVVGAPSRGPDPAARGRGGNGLHVGHHTNGANGSVSGQDTPLTGFGAEGLDEPDDEG